MHDPIEIFSKRARNYLRYRPGYPSNLLDLLRSECQLTKNSVIADIGCGTGLLAQVFLPHGIRVHGIEPNLEMRAAADLCLQRYANFNSHPGRAEATGLPNHCVDFVTAGQAFHWFDIDLARKEFERILRPRGWVVIVDNILVAGTPFFAALQQFNQEYLGDKDLNEAEVDIFARFFEKNGFCETLLNGETQNFAFDGLLGRICSRANSPLEGDPKFQEMGDALERIFTEHQQDGKVALSYRTQVIYGRI